MNIHILGVAGTFMGGLAQLLKAQGHAVTGSDAGIYPPMSEQLAQAGIETFAYGDHRWLTDELDVVVIGNALSRGHEDVEAVLNSAVPYVSGPQMLAEQVLRGRWVLGVAGTHGKTTTTAMLAWILDHAGLNPGFLVGGVPENFGVSARPGEAPFFVIEADEYDTAFFDKRSKFVHYRPRTCVINNLEFDHADIFEDLAAIQRQFHHLVRTVPGNGLIVTPARDAAVEAVLEMGCWTPVERHGEHIVCRALDGSGQRFEVLCDGGRVGEVSWPLAGAHNLHNATSALIAARHAGVPIEVAVEALGHFKGVRRRQTLVGEVSGIRILDDFAHHPTAIATTLAGLRPAHGRLIAVFEPRSNTMRMGVHRDSLPEAFHAADAVIAFVDPEWGWTLPDFPVPLTVAADYDAVLEAVLETVKAGDTVVFMSNGAFGGLPRKLLDALSSGNGTAE